MAKVLAPEGGCPFEPWIGPDVPVAVSPATVSALPRAFAAIVASAADVAVLLAVS